MPGALLLALLRPASAQITTENAGVIPPGTPILRESLSYFDSEDLDEVRWSNQVVFAFDPTREIKLDVPVLRRDVIFAGTSGEEHDSLSGLGDVSLRFKRSLLRKNEIMASTRLALLAEVEAPTGERERERHDDPEEPTARHRRLDAGRRDRLLLDQGPATHLGGGVLSPPHET